MKHLRAGPQPRVDRRRAAALVLGALAGCSTTIVHSGFAPYVRAGVHVTMPDGNPLYRKFYVMTDRSFNMFSDTLPARLAYQLPELSAAVTERARAVDALAQIASQLGEYYATFLAP